MKFIKQIKPKYLIGAIIVFLLVILIQAGFTFAYFDALITGNDTASTNTVGSLYPNLTLKADDAFNSLGWNAGTMYNFTFSVTNTGNSTIESYKIFLSDVTNTFSKKDELNYYLTCSSTSGTCKGTSPATFPVGNEMILEQSSIAPGVTHNYIIRFSYLTPTDNHSNNEGKNVTFKISLGEIIGDNLLVNKIIAASGGADAVRKKASPNLRKTGISEVGLYVTQDDDGDTYYYRGGVNYNYIKYANQIWRIVRINGDGTIRLVLNDYLKTGNADVYELPYNSTSECQNITSMDAAIECAKYGHGAYAGTSIANEINEWYYLNFSDEDKQYVVQNGKFCNDYSKSAIGTNSNYFGESSGIVSISKATDLTCSAESEYTYGEAKILNLPVGLLSAEEVIFAGAYNGTSVSSNGTHYLYIDNYNSWTMTPYLWNSTSYKNYSFIYGSPTISNDIIDNSYAIRPVINLKATVMVSGSGTSTDPYEIIGGPSTLADKVLANEGGKDTIENRIQPDFASSVNGDDGMYATFDQDGKTYYYHGGFNDIKDNYFYFADQMWRIIRINGDGSVRIIKNTYSNQGKYNSNSNCVNNSINSINTAIECLKYGHGEYADDSIANTLNDWYNTNIPEEEKKYIKKDAKFCNNYSYQPFTATITSLKFGTFYRDIRKGFPNLTCEAQSGYTSGEAKTLYLPIGLITVDELILSGKVMELTDDNVSYGSNMTISMSPFWWKNNTVSMAVSSDQYIGEYSLSTNVYIRPVINIYGDVTVIGNGTSSNPYTIYEY